MDLVQFIHFMAKMAENYMTNEQENVSVEVGRSGTSAGFKKFLVEQTELISMMLLVQLKMKKKQKLIN